MRIDNKNPIGLRVRYLMTIDLAAILLAITFSFTFRYEALMDIGPYLVQNWTLLLLVPLIRLPVYYNFGLYRRLWRYASMKDLKAIVLAGIVAFILIYIFNFILLPFMHIPYCPSHSVVVLEGGISLAFLTGTRFLLRLIQERATQQDLDSKTWIQNPPRVLIAGAGYAGAMILREVQRNSGLAIHVVGFVDDDREKLRMHIHGIPVLGTREDIPSLVAQHRIDEIIIAMPTAPGKEIRAIRAICEKAGVRTKVLPGMGELIDGTVSIKQIRDLRIEDLLRREPVHTDTAGVAALLRAKRVMVTGAGGSIGSELCRQILRCQPTELILLGHGENSLFNISNELRRSYPNQLLSLVIADIRDQSRLATVFSRYHPEVIFHAAAHKHVPLMESNVEEAVTNNVLGTRNLVEFSVRNNVSHFVLISSDKAVNPTSVMGVTKRIAELIVQDAALSSKRCFVAVRFGNVLGSRGSVVPLFQEQIARGGPVTVTHPEMRRYFMTIPEAVELVLQAAALGQGGEVFILDMGEPVKILDLAHDLIALSGLQVGRDIDIEITGLRPGEKLFEELFRGDENHVRTQHERVLVCRNGSTPIHIPSGSPWKELVEALLLAAQAGDSAKTCSLLRELVPEYNGTTVPSSGERKSAEHSPSHGIPEKR